MANEKYDIKDVDDYMERVIARGSGRGLMRLWLALQDQGGFVPADLMPSYEAFQVLHPATQAAVMYRFLPILEQVALDGFQQVNKAARDSGAI